MTTTSSKASVLDVRGTRCPYPQLKTKVALEQIRPGEILKVKSDDQASKENICFVAKQLGDTVVRIDDHGEEFTIVIQKSQCNYKSALGMTLTK